MQSINLFAPSPSIEQKQNHSVVTKRDKLRLQIRRTSINMKFQTIRKNLMEDLNSETLKSLIANLEEQGFNQSNLKNVIDILDNNCSDAKFTLKFAQDKLEEVLIKLLMEHSQTLSLEEKCRLVSALNYLTYFSDNSSKNLAQRQDFVDFLRKQIQKLQMDQLQQLCYFKMMIILLMNLSSILRQDFNLYLAESDISKNINHQIAQTVNIAKHIDNDDYHTAVYSIREDILRLYKNIVNKIKGSPQVPVTLVQNLLLDEIYLKEHKEKVFLLLTQAMHKEEFWSCFRKSQHNQFLTIGISQAMDFIQQRCFSKEFDNSIDNVLTEQEDREFYAMICFLNQLYGEDQFDDFDWFTVIEATFNGYMLAEFLIESIQKRDKNKEIEALRMYEHLSKAPEVSAQQLIITRRANQPLQLIKIFAGNQQLLVGCPTGISCMQILTNLLRKNPQYLKDILAQRIVDFLQIIFADQESKGNRLCSAINLVHEMIVSDICLNTKQKSEIVHIFENRGLIKRIEKLIDHQNRDVYTRAECFTEFIADKRQ